MDRIIFVSSNRFKAEEIKRLGVLYNLNIESSSLKINELQIIDIEQLVKDKTLQAFKCFGYPVLVDHACLEIECLNNMPGVLTQIFWDCLQGKICQITDCFGNRNAVAKSTFGFCDGKKLFTVTSKKIGTISDSPRGTRAFQWDTIFIPDGETRTYSEMSIDEKNNISQRKNAFEELVKIL